MKLSPFIGLRDDERSYIDRLYSKRRIATVGHDLVSQGDVGHKAFILQRGWVCSYKLRADGSRQIVDFQIPGDFLGLRSILLRTSDHSFEPITEVEVSEVPSSDLLDVFREAPRLAAAVLWAASRDEAMVVEHLVSIGRRSALMRTAHYLLELGSRLKLVGLGTSDGFTCPLSQYHLADALGLSAIHLNRCLRQLREDGLVTFRKGVVTFDNLGGLIEAAEFDALYLDHVDPLL